MNSLEAFLIKSISEESWKLFNTYLDSVYFKERKFLIKKLTENLIRGINWGLVCGYWGDESIKMISRGR